jgi:hypothetical protein
MKTVALLGGAESTRDQVWNSNADEIWTANWTYLYDYCPRIDRLFEMHPIWVYGDCEKPEWTKPYKHWRWLQDGEKGYPIYMMVQHPKVPSSVRYPIEDITEDLFGNRLLRGDEPTDLYSSSADYMLAMAIYEGFDKIELYGVEMGSSTEYKYQREGASYFIGAATGRGITVQIPPKSIIMKSKKYGYEGGQMIFRQDLEAMLRHWAKLKRDRFAMMSNVEGRLQALHAEGKTSEEMRPLAFKCSEARENAAVASGWVDCLTYQIKEVDLEEHEMELRNPFETITEVS